MNSDQLRFFKAIYESGNLTKAAEKLYITQPALSMSLSKLEDELGTKLFVRKGRVMEATPDGEKLMEYAIPVLSILNEATNYFATKDDLSSITLYRIGGVGASLLISGYYGKFDQELKLQLIYNSDVTKVVSWESSVLLIADDRFIPNDAKLKRQFLYHQKLLLSVHKDDELAKRKSIDFRELANYELVGRTGNMGFTDWVHLAETDNNCALNEVGHMDYIFFATEGQHLKRPFLMSSFGESVNVYSASFSERVSIPVTGQYAERDIYLYYNPKYQQEYAPLIELIKENARKIDTADKEEKWSR